MTATGLGDKMDDPNVIIESNAKAAGAWHFVHVTKDADGEWEQYDDAFAFVAGRAPLMATLDHFGAKHVVASYDRYWPSHSNHMWKPISRGGGTFSFKNIGTGRLLSQTRTTRLVDTAPTSAFENQACQWRLVDVTTDKPFSILYDSTEIILPEEYAGPRTEALPMSNSRQHLTLRTEVASMETGKLFEESLKSDHALIREMLQTGYTSLVVVPQSISGWKDGRLTHIKLQDEEMAFGMPQFRGKGDYSTCE